MRTYVRVRFAAPAHLEWRRGDHPARRPRCVLRLGGAAGRPRPAGSSGDRRRRRRAGRELRGEGVRGAHGQQRCAGAAPVPARRRGAPTNVGVRGREQGGVRSLRPDDAPGRGTVDRRGLPRRRRSPQDRWRAGRHRGASAPGRTRAGGSADHGRDRENEVSREGRQRGGQTRRTAARAAGPRDRVPPSAAGRKAVGCRRGDVGQAPRRRDRHRWAARPPSRRAARVHRRTRGGPPPPRARLGTRPASRAGGAQAEIRRRAARSGAQTEVEGGCGRRSGDVGGPGGRPIAPRRAGRAHGGAPAAVRRLHPGDAFAHTRAAVGSDADDPHDGPRPAEQRDADDRTQGHHPRGNRGGQPRGRLPATAGAAVRPVHE